VKIALTCSIWPSASSPKAGHFEPAEFGDRYEVEMVEVLKKKQAGMPVKKEALVPPFRAG
jgi:non-homologous end joining protein Ku